jgi:NAD(P)-dependent dehydrogenase (short-subunit alcohol dehydrogenase family)
MKTKKLAAEVAVVTGESKGIGAAIARLMKRRNVINIIERFQTQHALQEERGVPDKNGMSGNSIFETEEVRVSTIAVPNAEWSPPHDGPIPGGLHGSG